MSPRWAHLDPDVVARIAHLAVRANSAAEGALTGLHRSRHRGASVIFVEHREYRPGDDPRLLDWRAYARTDRPTLRRFEQETQLHATMMLDRSASLDFSGAPTRPTKHEHATTLLGGLALLLLRQGDRVGALTFDDRVRRSILHGSGINYLDPILETLVAGEPTPATALGPSLTEALPRAGRRGLVVIASDLLDEDDDGIAALRSFKAKGHDVWVLHVLDPSELELELDGACRVLGLEGEPPVEVPGAQVRDAYRKTMGAFLGRTEAACRAMGIHYVLARTDVDPGRTLAQILARSELAPNARNERSKSGLRAS